MSNTKSHRRLIRRDYYPKPGVHMLSALVLAGLLFVQVFTVTTDADDLKSAVTVIEGLQKTLISVMKEAEVLGYQGRYERLAPQVKATHDLHSIARIVVGRYWRRMSEERKTEFIETFSELSIATYAHKFDGYNGEVFKIISQENMDDRNIIVRTVLIKTDGEEIGFDYQMRKRGNKWLILNIIADGVSDLALKRTEYTGIIEREGFDALINKLQEKIVLYSQTEQTR